MKKTIICILTAILSISTLATAATNPKTYLGSLKPQETKNITVQIQEGKSTLEVFNPYVDSKFRCEFIDSESGITGSIQENVNRCSVNIILKNPMIMDVKISNLEDKIIDFRLTMELTK